jgi:hypothetical protein
VIHAITGQVVGTALKRSTIVNASFIATLSGEILRIRPLRPDD